MNMTKVIFPASFIHDQQKVWLAGSDTRTAPNHDGNMDIDVDMKFPLEARRWKNQ